MTTSPASSASGEITAVAWIRAEGRIGMAVPFFWNDHSELSIRHRRGLKPDQFHFHYVSGTPGFSGSRVLPSCLLCRMPLTGFGLTARVFMDSIVHFWGSPRPEGHGRFLFSNPNRNANGSIFPALLFGACIAMVCTCVIGLQWGDEAKGKIVDLLTDQHDLVVRYNGGANAGHTVVHGGKTFKFSLLPTGVIKPQVRSVIGNGVVIYPPRFLEEVDNLRKAEITVGDNLVVSNHVHVIFPYHFEEERLNEQGAAGTIGTTGRGIGPCY